MLGVEHVLTVDNNQHYKAALWWIMGQAKDVTQSNE